MTDRGLRTTPPGSLFSALDPRVAAIVEELRPFAVKAEAGPLSFADVNRVHALFFDLLALIYAEDAEGKL